MSSINLFCQKLTLGRCMLKGVTRYDKKQAALSDNTGRDNIEYLTSNVMNISWF